MKLLRIILIGFILFCFQYKSYALYFTYSVSVSEYNISVTVRPDFTFLSPSNYCKWKFTWTYQGTLTRTKEVSSADIRTYSETFTYPLNSQYISAGMFGDGINLDLTTYFGTNGCTDYTTVNDYQYVQKDLGTTTILATLDYSPKYPDGVPKNTDINFNFIFTQGSNTNLDHLTYDILINNSAVFQGGATNASEFGQTKSWTYGSGFPNPGTYTAQVQVNRFGLVVGLSDLISITVKADPAPPQPPIPQCVSGLNPALQVDAVVNNDKIDLTFKDISSSTFKTTFGGKSKYALLVTDADNIGYTVAGGKSINDYINYPAAGFATLTRTYNLSSIIKPSYTFTINFLTQCKDASGVIQTRSDPKTISVPGKPFNPATENVVNIPPAGKLNQNVDIRAGYCKSILLDQPDSQLGNSNWVTNINLSGNFLTFDVAPNYEIYDRTMGIKVFVNGYYDPCLSIEDGFTKTYRNIEVSQASQLKDIKSPSTEVLPLPKFDTEAAIKYFSTQEKGNPAIAGYFLKDLPLQSIIWLNNTVSANTIKGYDVNNKLVWQANFTIQKYPCETNLTSYNASVLTYTSTNYFGAIINTPYNITIDGSYERGLLYVTAGNQITFKPGFQAKGGSILNASIQPCTTESSLAMKIDTVKSNKLPEAIIAPQSVQEQKTIQVVSQVSIYPNPNEGKFSIDMRNLNEAVIRIEIYNSAGTMQKVLNKGIKTIEDIDLSKAPSDTYFIKIISDRSIYNYKIVIL